MSTSTLNEGLTTVFPNGVAVLSVALNSTVLVPSEKNNAVTIPVFTLAPGVAATAHGLELILYESFAIVTAPERPADTLALVVNVTAPVFE